MDTPDISVYGEAKSEYTRQLIVFLVPVLEAYFLNLLEKAKQESTSSQKILWNFQLLLQSIPDWNQDKVINETEKIQKDTKCDYLEELLTAVFIAHTKVLSAIRLSSKQKKLQITIPKIDHFLHRLLSESARTLWTNAFLFAETGSIEKQKNLRQVSMLLQDSVLQAIRGLLPVKSILYEYLREDEEETDEQIPSSHHESEPVAQQEVQEESVPVAVAETVPEKLAVAVPEVSIPLTNSEKVEEEVVQSNENKSSDIETTPEIEGPQTIVIDTKPSVSFTQEHVFFDSDNLDQNEIHDSPFAEAELRVDDEEDDDEFSDNEIDSLQITEEVLPMEADEIFD